MNDPIADMLTRVRNALAVHKTEVVLPASKMKLAIAQLLVREGFLSRVENVSETVKGTTFESLRLLLKYSGPKQPAITNLHRVSRPGRRVYVTKDQLPVVLNNLGVAIISTSHGLMTNKQARKVGLGGEVLCEVY